MRMKSVHNLILIFTAVTMVSIAQAAQVESVENTFNCYAEYLKARGLLEQNFHTDPFVGNFQLCEATVTAASQMQLTTIREKFMKVESLKDSVDCVVDRLRTSMYNDFQLLKEVLEETRLLKDEEKISQLKEVTKVLKMLSTDSVQFCLRIRDFSETYDIMFDKDEEEDLVGDYCVRQHVLEKGLIDTNLYKVDLNPANITTQNIECDKIISSELKQLEGGIRLHESSKLFGSEQIECVIRMYHKNDYFSRVMAIGVLGELNLTEDQKKLEKEKFLKKIINLSEQMPDCFQRP